MKKYILTIAIIAACYVSSGQTNETLNFADASTGGAEAIATAFREQRSGVQVAGEGVVVRILPDDSDGPRHQRFILSLASGQTLLVAHNIDIAPRLTSLKSGDLVAFNGVYEWNAKGGTVHWTHRDPSGRRRERVGDPVPSARTPPRSRLSSPAEPSCRSADGGPG